jgi:16S rRNA C1402 N4-methylase RsmH
MLPSVLPTEIDHVPVLADEIVATLDPRPGETLVDATFGAGGHAALLAARLRGDGKLIAIDRDPTVAPYFERVRRASAVKSRLLHGEFSATLLEAAGITREVTVAGVSDHLEIWDRAAWRQQLHEVEGSAEDVAERLAN